MHFLEMSLLAFLLVVLPVYEAVFGARERELLKKNPAKKVANYQFTMLTLWCPAVLALALYYGGMLSVPDIGLSLKVDWPNAAFLVLLLAYIGYCCFDLRRVSADSEYREKLAVHMQELGWLLPRTQRETRWFCVGVSMTAGVTEEILFRGYLMNLFSQWLGFAAGICLSIAAFGLMHWYQGVLGILRTSIVGALLTLVYLLTDSLLLPILFHVWVDMYAGLVSYRLMKSSGKSPTGGSSALA